MSTKIYEHLVIDKETGEILKSSTIYRKHSDYIYFQTTMNTVEHIEMLTAHQYKLTGILQPYVEFNTNIIDLTPTKKKLIASKMGIQVRSFYILFDSLKKSGWIIKHKENWIINPLYMWAGSITIRASLIDEIREDRLE